MKKQIKVFDSKGYPIQNLYAEVEGQSFVSNRNGLIELIADSPNSIVRFNYIGSKPVEKAFNNLSDQIVINNKKDKSCGCNSDCKCNTPQAKPITTTKTIQVFDTNGNPVKNAHVVNISQNTGTITNSEGVAQINGNADDLIEITHVSFSALQRFYSNLPNTIKLETQSLDEVNVFADNKPKNAGAWLLGLFALGGLLMKHSSIKSKGLNQPANEAVEITL